VVARLVSYALRVKMWALPRAALCVAFVLSPTALLAHAYVVASSPAAGDRLDRSPRMVGVSFDEPVTIESGDPLELRDRAGKTIACVPSAAVDPQDATRVVCRLSHALERGTYALQWRVTSADTHVVHGEIDFGIGVDAPSSAQITRSVAFDPGSPLAAALRFVMLFASLIACGAVVFGEQVVERGGTGDGARRRCRSVAYASAAVALVASFPALAVQTIAATGAMPHSLLSLASTIWDSQWGHAWLVRAAGLLGLIALLSLRGAGGMRLAPLAMLGVLISFSLSGHAMHASDPRLSSATIIADLLHTGGAAIWVGGIVAYLAALRELDAVRGIVAFSPWAVAAVVAIAISGTYASVVHIGSVEGLFDNTYGLLVVAKIVLLVPLIAYGARNMSRGNGSLGPSGFSAELKIEATLLLLVVALSAILTGVAPPAQPMPSMSVMQE
jgi:copper transport protein